MKKFLPKKNFTQTLLVGLVFLFFSTTSYSQIIDSGIDVTTSEDLCTTVGKCEANSVDINGAYFGFGNGDPVTSCDDINPSNEDDIWVFIDVKPNSNSKYNFFAKFRIVNIDQGTDTIYTVRRPGLVEGGLYKIVNVQYACGEEFQLKDILITWTANSNGVPDCPSSENYSQCNGDTPDILVDGPLVAKIEYEQICNSTYDVIITSRSIGGRYDDKTTDPPTPIANPYKYILNFGDGSDPIITDFLPSNYEFPSHLYEEDGPYTVTLTVEDGTGTTNTDDFEIGPFVDPIEAAPEVTSPIGCLGETATIKLNGSGGNGTLTYEFNGSSNSTGIFENVPAGEDQEFVITDVLGCDYISSINVPGGDDTSPVITAPENTDIEACSIAAGLADYSETAVDITGNEATYGFSVVEESSYTVTYKDATTGSCPWVVTRTFTVTDYCGYSDSDTQTIIIDDTTAPAFTASANFTVEGCGTDAITGWTFSTSAVDITASYTDSLSVTEACGVKSVSYTDVQTGACPIEVTRTFTVIDNCDNETSHAQTIYINDTTAPAFTAPANFTVEGCGTDAITGWTFSTSAVDITASYTDSLSVTEACGVKSVSYTDVQTGACPIEVTRTFTVIDNCDNETSHAQTIYIDDTTAPAFTAPANFTVEGCGTEAITGWTFSTSAVDITASYTDSLSVTEACGVKSVSYTDVQTGACPIEVTRTFTVIDNCDNETSHAQTIYIDDTTAPAFTAPANFTVEGCGTEAITGWTFSTSAVDITASYTDSLSVTEACGVKSVSYTDVQTGACPIEVTRTFTVIDNCDNETSHAQTIYIDDTTAPAFTAPANFTVEGCGTDAITGWTFSTSAVDITASYTDSLSVTEACGVKSVSYTDVQTGACPIEVTRTFTVIDNCDNETSHAQTIYIDDTTAPAFTAPANFTVEGCGTDAITGWTFSTSAVDITASYTDSLSVTEACGVKSVSYTDVQTGACPIEVTRTFTVIDNCDNETSHAQTIYIDDTTAPAFTAPANFTVEGCGTEAITGWTFSTSAVDITASYTDSLSVTEACGVKSVSYTDVQTGACPIEVTRTFTVIDNCDNETSHAQTIYIDDTTAPAFTAPANFTVEGCGTDAITGWTFSTSAVDITASYTDSLSVTEACGVKSVSYTDVQTGACPIEVTRTFTVIDNCDNETSHAQTIYIDDTTAPAFTAPANFTVEGCGTDAITGWTFSTSAVDITASYTDSLSVTEACGVKSVSYTDVQTGACPIEVTRTFTVIDNCDNETSHAQTIYIDDTTAPAFTAPANFTVEGCGTDAITGWTFSTSAVDITASYTDSLSVTEACGVKSVSYTDVQTGACPIEVTRTFTVIDNCDNETSHAQTIYIDDTTAPAFTAPANFTVEGCGTDAITGWTFSTSAVDITASYTDSLSVTEACGVKSVSYTDVQTGACPIEVTRTFTVIDNCDNETSHAQTIYIDDTTAPAFTTPANFTVEGCGTEAITGWTFSTSAVDITASYTDSLSVTEACGVKSVSYTDVQTGACPIEVTRTFTVIDNCDNETSHAQTIYIDDTTAPAFTAPANFTVEGCGTEAITGWTFSTSAVDITASYTDSLSVTEACGVKSVSYTDVQTGACPIEVTRTFTVIDNCDNETSHAQTIYIDDTTAPAFTAPANFTVEGCGTDAITGWTFSTSAVDITASYTDSLSVTEACGVKSVSYTDVQTGACPIEVTRTFTVIDNCDNETSHAQTIYIDDTTAPAFTAPANFTVEGCGTEAITGWTFSTSAVDITASYTDSLSVTEACGVKSVSYTDVQTGACPIEVTRTFTVIDNCDNETSHAQTIYIDDTTAPAFTAPANFTVEGCGTEAITGWTFSTSAVDITASYTDSLSVTEACGVKSVSYTDVQTGACPIEVTRTFTVIDNCDNETSHAQTIYINDTTAPAFTAPANFTVEGCGTEAITGWTFSTSAVDITASYTDSLSVTEACGVKSVSYTDVQTGACPIEVTRTFTVIDNCDNETSHAQTIYIDDTTAPAFTAPANFTVEGCGTDAITGWTFSTSAVDITASYTDSLSVTEACGVKSVSYTDVQTGACPIEVTRTFTVIDNCDNETSHAQTIYIDDTTAPAFTAPANFTVEGCGTEAITGWTFSTSAVDITASYTDSLSVTEACGVKSVSYTDVQTGACPIEVTRTFTVIDNCDNETSHAQTIYIDDTTAPAFTAPANFTVEGCGTEAITGWTFSTSAVDITASYTDSLSVTEACGVKSVSYTDVQTGACPIEVTRTFTVIDNCDNETSHAQTIYIDDTTAPAFTAPANFTVEGCGTDAITGWTFSTSAVDITASYTDSLSVTEACGVKSVSYTDVQTGACPIEVTRTFTVIDNCDNETSHAQTIYIDDTTAPAFTAPANFTVEGCGTEAITGWTFSTSAVDITASYTDSLSVTEACGVKSVSYTDVQTGACPIEVTRTFTVIDNCDNETSHAQTIYIDDTTAPAFTAPANFTVEGCGTDAITGWTFSTSAVDITASYTDSLSVTEACGVKSVSYTDVQTGACPIEVTRTFTVIDNCDNETSHAQTIYIDDTTAPAFTAPANFTVEGCGTDAITGWTFSTSAVDITASYTDSLSVTEACGVKSVSYTDVQTGACPIEVTRTFTVIDNCDNKTSHAQTIYIDDTTAPAFTAPEDFTVEGCGTDAITGWTFSTSAVDITASYTDSLSVTEACGVKSVSYTDVQTGACPIEVTRTFTVIDNCDNETSHAQTIYIDDTTAPVFTAPEDFTVEGCGTEAITGWTFSTSAVDITASYTDSLSVTEACGVKSVSYTDVQTGACPIEVTRTFTVIDNCDNETSHAQTIYIDDTTAPAFTAPEDFTVEGCGTDAITGWTFSTSAVDITASYTDSLSVTEACGVKSVSYTDVQTGACPIEVTRTFTVIDNCDNKTSHAQTIYIDDTTAPAFTAPEDFTVEGCGTDAITGWTFSTSAVDITASYTDSLSVTEACGVKSVSYTDVQTGACPIEVTRTFTVIDNCDNKTSHAQTIYIDDTTAPVFTAPEDFTVEGCGTDAITGWTFSTSAVDITASYTDSLSVTEACGVKSVSYTDVQTGACPIEVTRTFTVIDNCDNETSHAQTIYIDDTTAPAFTAPEDFTVEGCGTDAITGWTFSTSAVDITASYTDSLSVTEACGVKSVSYTDVQTGACPIEVTRTFTVIDNCDNKTSHAQTIYIDDTTAPAFTAPEDFTVEGCGTDAITGWTFSTSAVDITASYTDSLSVTEACGVKSVSYTDVQTGACPIEVTRTFTVIDNCDNKTSHAQTIYIDDTTAPVFTAPEDFTVEGCGTDAITGWTFSTSAVDITASYTDSLSVTEACGVKSVSYTDVQTGACPIEVTRTFTVIDNCDNKTSHAQTIYIDDTTAPAIVETAMEDLTVECADDWSAELAAWLENNAGATASDLCGEVTWSNNYNTQTLTDECGATGQLTVTFTATDECDNTSTTTAVFKIEDTIDPTIDNTNLTNIDIECGIDPVSKLSYWLANHAGATATDNCGDVTWSNNYGENQNIQCDGGAITVIFTATDACGNASTTSASYSIQDNTTPTFNETLPTAEITAECDAIVEADVLTASDNCDTDVPVVFAETRTDGDCANSYTLTRTWTATDNCGNKASHTQTVVVSDNTAPTFNETLPTAEITAECDAVVEAVVLTASDNCDSDVPVVFTETKTDGDCANNYTLIRTWTATDDCGNETSFTQKVIVSDNTAPTFNETLPTAEITAECDAVVEAVVLTASDNCDSDVSVVFTETRTDGNCANNYTLTRVWTATDDCGNETSFTQTVVVSDNTTPTFNETLPTAEITAECDAVVEAVILTASDNCDSDVSVVFTETRTDGNCANNYTLTRVWTATDDCGNETSFTQTVVVSDNTAPTFNETLPTTEITAECDAVVEAVVLTTSDNCDTDVPVVFTETKTDGDCANSYTLTRTWTATDNCGNETSHTQTVVVSDNTAPEVTCNDLTVQLEANGSATITVDDINGGTTDACSDIDTMFISQATFNCDNIGENEVNLTVIDECGNVSTCTATVTVEEGDADCGLQPFKANDDILSLVYCPDETVSGELDLFANDEGFTPENVNFTILTDLPEGVSVTDGNLLYANENPTEAVITFTYSVCHTVNTENCSTAEVTIQLLVDTDCDDVPDIDDLDDDDDGILDIIEEENALDQTSLDSDGDGIVDRLDIDADNDGIVDNVEWQSTIAEGGEYDYIFPLGTDSNGDGWDDAYDPASNGITYEPWDMDLDGTPDYLDTNTDNEGEDDNVEGWDKFPNDSIADISYIGSDADKDGLDDAYDTYNTTTEEWAPGQNAIGSDAYLQDTDDDGVRDWRDAVDDRTPPEQFACGDPVIPNAFSPNQDGYNDYFKVMIYCTGTQGGNEERVLGDDFSDARIEIFNRWGNLVYEQERYGNEDYWGDVDAWWNGRSTHNMQVGSDQLPTATYYYILYFNDGNREPITGFVFLNN